VRFPVPEELVLFRQAGERASPQCVVLDVLHAAFDLSLVTRRVGPGRQESRAVVRGKGLQLGMDLGIVPVRLTNLGFRCCVKTRILDH
jgi:hypothetical protein